MSENHLESTGDAFIDYLISLVKTKKRAALAELRKGLGKSPEENPNSFRYISWFVNLDNPRREGSKYLNEVENIYHLVSTLFAVHQNNVGTLEHEGPNLGESYAQLSREVGSDSIEKRFIALLNSSSEDMAEHLRSAIFLMKSKEIPINWALLLKHLKSWGNEDRRVQRKWARSFWKSTLPPDSDDNTTQEPSTED